MVVKGIHRSAAHEQKRWPEYEPQARKSSLLQFYPIFEISSIHGFHQMVAHNHMNNEYEFYTSHGEYAALAYTGNLCKRRRRTAPHGRESSYASVLLSLRLHRSCHNGRTKGGIIISDPI